MSTFYDDQLLKIIAMSKTSQYKPAIKVRRPDEAPNILDSKWMSVTASQLEEILAILNKGAEEPEKTPGYPETPMLNKMIAVQQESRTIGEFIEWLDHNRIKHDGKDNIAIDVESYETILARFFGIDLAQAEREKQAILAHTRAENEKTLLKDDLTFNADADGYTLYYRGFPIGGSSVVKTDKHRTINKAILRKANANSARKAIDNIVEHGAGMYEQAVREIQEGKREQHADQ